MTAMEIINIIVMVIIVITALTIRAMNQSDRKYIKNIFEEFQKLDRDVTNAKEDLEHFIQIASDVRRDVRQVVENQTNSEAFLDRVVERIRKKQV